MAIRKENREIRTYIDLEGMRVSEVTPVSGKIELEAVLHSKKEPEQIRLYFDADKRNPYGPSRPQLVVNMALGGNVASIALYWEGKEKMRWENK